MCTTDDISDQLQPVEDITRFELIPAMCGKADISDDEPLQRSILGVDGSESCEIDKKMANPLQRNTKEESRRAVKEAAEEIGSHLSHTTRRGMELAQEKGAWLTTLPIEEHGYALHKGAFRDAVAFALWVASGVHAKCLCLWQTQ